LDAAVGVDDDALGGVAPTCGHPKALVTSTVVWLESIGQPTTRRENASRTTQQ